MIKKIKQYFCKHKWQCMYIYGTTALWRCKKCDKTKHGFAPVGLTQDDINREIIEERRKAIASQEK